VWEYMGKAEQHDDITFVCFGPNGHTEEPQPPQQ